MSGSYLSIRSRSMEEKHSFKRISTVSQCLESEILNQESKDCLTPTPSPNKSGVKCKSEECILKNRKQVSLEKSEKLLGCDSFDDKDVKLESAPHRPSWLRRLSRRFTRDHFHSKKTGKHSILSCTCFGVPHAKQN